MSSELAEFRQGWKIVLAAAFGVGVGLIGAPIFSLGTLLVPLSKAFGWSRAEVSLASLCLVFGTIVTALFVGRFVDRFGVRRIGIISLCLLAVAFVGMTQITANIYTFYLGLVLLSLAGCGTSPIIWTRGVATWFDKKRGLAFGMTLAGTGVAAMLMPPFVGSLIAQYDWRAGYLGLAAVTAVALIPVVLFFYERGEKHVDTSAPVLTGFTLQESLKTRHFWQLGVGNVLVTGATAALVVHFVALLTDAGITSAVAVGVAGIIGAAIIVGRLLTGYLVDRFHAPYVGAALVLLPCAGAILMRATLPDLTWVSVSAVTIGLAAGAEVDLVAFLVSRYFGLKSYGQIYAAQFILFELAVGFGPVIAGRLFDIEGSYDTALLVCAAAYVGAATAIGTLGKPPTLEKIGGGTAHGG
ncbi:MAG: MFS transporter [Rhodospirillaceae bacterium]|nr:MFS transporter [Rhodospirillaceae bacterium]